MEFVPTRLPEVVLIKPRVFGDPRGYFLETFRADRFATHGIDATFVQDNHSHSQRGTLRWNDPAVGIEWPIPPGVEPLLSAKDSAAPPLAAIEGLA